MSWFFKGYSLFVCFLSFAVFFFVSLPGLVLHVSFPILLCCSAVVFGIFFWRFVQEELLQMFHKGHEREAYQLKESRVFVTWQSQETQPMTNLSILFEDLLDRIVSNEPSLYEGSMDQTRSWNRWWPTLFLMIKILDSHSWTNWETVIQTKLLQHAKFSRRGCKSCLFLF